MATKKEATLNSCESEIRIQMQPFQSAAAPVCSKTKPLFVRKDSPDGSCELVENGKIDFYEQIQSWKEDTEYSVILERMEAGDVSAQNQYQDMLLRNGYDVADGVQEGVFPDLRTVLNSFCEAREFYDDNGGKDTFGCSFDEFFQKFDLGEKPQEQPKQDLPKDEGGKLNAET